MPKRGLGMNVLQAARERISFVFDRFSKIYVSFSGGKDSTTMLHLVVDEAKKRGLKVAVLFIDLEAQYKMTIDHVQKMFDMYRDYIEPYWIALPLQLRNAVSMYEPHWICWEPGKEEIWVRQPPKSAITDQSYFPFFRYAMEFEEFVEDFGRWYGGADLTACFVGIRADESLNRYRTLITDKIRYQGKSWTTWKGENVFNVYPIYDWRTEDIWTHSGKFGLPHNRLYDYMHKAGLSIHQQRICQPYGDDQRKGLWLYHLLEPETWPKVVARVNGANSGALYAQETGNILGRIRISKPEGHTWESFSKLLLASMPPKTKEHYSNKIAVFLKWWAERGYEFGIPDEADPKDEAAKKVPSWRRICKVLLRNDYWCKGLSFTQTKSDAYEKYMKVMKERRKQWGYLIW
ncbi:phosphoadenosine phosphosulfate reductase [Paenibacillus sp. Pae108]|uniref:phosphoadenosine phosphosulfate reductase n=1 Tax=Paenibacillus sp. Pae108 TaxID=2926019 RepID=UPI002117C313|nr:DUF3440 domain-containing protein [Paenibacillus sp. Pae108]